MLPLLTAATARELLAALPQGTALGRADTKPETRLTNGAGANGTVLTACAGCSEHALHEHCLYTVSLAGKKWLACITGVGPINAALAMGLALARFPAITAVLNVGLAGTFDLTRAPLGSTIAVSQEIWPEYGLADDAGVDAAGLGFPLWAKRGIIDRLPVSTDPVPMGLPPLLPSAPLALVPTGPSGVSPNTAPTPVNAVPQGTALTVAGVTNSAERARRLHQRYAALIENMEGFAVALACARHGIPLLELRTISNVTGSRLPQDRDFPRAFSAMNLFFTTYFTHTQ